jgi:hypothetical protein
MSHAKTTPGLLCTSSVLASVHPKDLSVLAFFITPFLCITVIIRSISYQPT